MEIFNGDKTSFGAAILDMDGVITKTAVIHAKAWKQMFDEFLERIEGADSKPLDINKDYHLYIDGIPRHDGIRSFLGSRNISLPDGKPEDPPEADTVFGLGKRKNSIFLSVLEKEGVEVYDDALEVMRIWKKNSIRLAVISSSRNCRHIIDKAGLSDFFDARVDGETLIKENLKGKPEPDMFLRACDLLGLTAGRSIVIEDAISGVEAGIKGNFGLVVGVARNKARELLENAGADVVVDKLTDLVNPSGRLRAVINSK